MDELYAFGPTPVFHNAEPETPNEYGCGTHGAFRGAIYRALRSVEGVEVQDRAFLLTRQHFHYPKMPLVSLRSSRVAPVAYRSSQVQGAPRWRQMVQSTSNPNPNNPNPGPNPNPNPGPNPNPNPGAERAA